MDYDYWLQKSAGCFDDYYEADDDTIFNWYDDKYNDVPVKEALEDYEIPFYVADAIIERMWEDEEVLKDLDAGIVDDLAEWAEKYPEQYKILYEKYKPKNADELFNLVGRDGWASISDDFYESLN